MLALSLVFYLFFVCMVAANRVAVRLHKGINGNPVEDFFVSLFGYPVASVQMRETLFGVGTVPLMPSLIPETTLGGDDPDKISKV